MPRNPLAESDVAYVGRELGLRAGALPELVAAYDALAAAGRALGIRFGVAAYGAVRTQTDTTRILGYRDADWAVAVKKDPTLPSRITKEKWRPIAPFGSSMHNYGAAFDAYIIEYPAGRSVQWAHDQLDLLAPKVGLKIGDTFNDEPHFELAISLDAARQKYAARGALQCPGCGGRGRVGHGA